MGNSIAFSVRVNMAPELRVSDIPPEAMAIISDCQVPLMLVGITWPYDLAKSPLLYANSRHAEPYWRQTETDHPAGLPLGSLFRIEGPKSCCPDEAGHVPVRLPTGRRLTVRRLQ